MRLIDADLYEVEEGDEVPITFRFHDGQELTLVAAPGHRLEVVSDPERKARRAVEVTEDIRRLLAGD
jgi:hypothetical protein